MRQTLKSIPNKKVKVSDDPVRDNTSKSAAPEALSKRQRKRIKKINNNEEFDPGSG